MEKCVLCGCSIDLEPDTPIEFRTGYIVGCGQLCMQCFSDLYCQKESESNDHVATEAPRVKRQERRKLWS